jgi:hypothetical protein
VVRYTAPGWQPPQDGDPGGDPAEELRVMRWLIAKHIGEAKKAIATYGSLTGFTVMLTPAEQRDLLRLLVEAWPETARTALADAHESAGPDE